jgi:hypothetical protein
MKEEEQSLKEMKIQLLTNELQQIDELNKHCNVSFQYAKTYSSYVKDWENTKEQMLDQLNSGQLPPDTSPEFHKEVIKVIDIVIKSKLEYAQKSFELKFGESIFNYLGKDGKTKGCFGVILFLIIFSGLISIFV